VRAGQIIGKQLGLKSYATISSCPAPKHNKYRTRSEVESCLLLLVLIATRSCGLCSGGKIGSLTALVCSGSLLTLLESLKRSLLALLLGKLFSVGFLFIFLGLLCLCLLLLFLVGSGLFGVSFLVFLLLRGFLCDCIGLLSLSLDIHFLENTLKLFVLELLLLGFGKLLNGFLLLGRFILGLLNGLRLIRRFFLL
jgi:hypothetical protein